MDSMSIVSAKHRKTSHQSKPINIIAMQALINYQQSTIPSMTRIDYLRSLSTTELQQLRKGIQRELFMLTVMPKITLLTLLSVLFMLVFLQQN